MNPASHLLIAAPCYFTWTTFLRFFFLFLFPSEEKVSSFRSIYLSRVLVTRDSIQRSLDFAFFLSPLFSVLFSPKNVGAFNGNSKILRFLSVKYWTELGSKCFERLRTCIDFPQSFPAPGGLSGKRIQIAEHGGA